MDHGRARMRFAIEVLPDLQGEGTQGCPVLGNSPVWPGPVVVVGDFPLCGAACLKHTRSSSTIRLSDGQASGKGDRIIFPVEVRLSFGLKCFYQLNTKLASLTQLYLLWLSELSQSRTHESKLGFLLTWDNWRVVLVEFLQWRWNTGVTFTLPYWEAQSWGQYCSHST